MPESNPYQSPEANLDQEPTTQNYQLREPVSVPAGRGWDWITEGFGYFKKSPGSWILILFVGFLILIGLGIIPVLGQIALMLTSYVWLAGLMLGCRAQDDGKPFEVKYLFSGFSNNLGKLILLSLVMGFSGILVAVAIMGPVYLSVITGGAEATQQIISDPTGFALSFLFVMLLMIPLMMMVWFAPVLVVLHDVPIFKALKLSFFGCLKNILPFLVFGVISFVLYIIAVIPFLLGLLVLVPTMIAAIYVAYKDIFIEPV